MLNVIVTSDGSLTVDLMVWYSVMNAAKQTRMKMKNKTVLYPISVPNGDYCWTYDGTEYTCSYFDNEGGHNTCELRFDNDCKKHKDGVIKAIECSALKEENNE